MKLYEIPNESKLQIWGVNGDQKWHKATFHHVDGLYSYCTIDDLPRDAYNVFHLHIGTPMKKVNDHYEIDEAAEMLEEVKESSDDYRSS